MPRIVEACLSHAGTLQQRLPGVIVGVRLDRVSEPICEDSTRLYPELTSSRPLLILFVAVIFQELDQLGRQPDFPLAGTGLDGSVSLFVCTRRAQRPGVSPHVVEQPCS